MPTAMAATDGRVASKVAMAGCLAPVRCCSRARASFSSSFSLPPSSREPGTRTSSSTTSAVCDALMPCFLYFWPCARPLVPGGMTKLAWPRPLSLGSTVATTTWMSAMPPLVIQALVPFSTHSSVASS
jgi:hypothetical protein